MSYEIAIVGPHQITGFNGTGVINLEDYYAVEIPKMEGYQFEYISSLDLSVVDECDDIEELRIALKGALKLFMKQQEVVAGLGIEPLNQF